jgi:PAS domain S-box-containing protein
LKKSETALSALASSDDLDTGDLRSFHEGARRVLQTQPDWFTIHLASPSAQQLLDVRQPFGAGLPAIRERASFDRVMRTTRPAIGNLYENAAHQLVFAVRVPVVRDGTLKYVLTACVRPQAISHLLSAQRLPQDWFGVVLDGSGHFVTRTIDPERNLGRPASPSLRAALDRNAEGWFYGNTLEGTRFYTAYNRSAYSGWTVALGIPASVVEAEFRRSLLVVVFFGLLFLALATGLATFLSKRTARSIKALSDMAEDFGSGKSLPPADYVPSRVSELEIVREAFVNAARLVQERSEERDRVVAELRQVSERLELAQEAGGLGSFERNLVTGENKWSASQEKLYGLPPGKFAGTYEAWKRLVHPDDLAAVENAVRISAETMSPLVAEFRIIRPDGEIRWLATQCRVFADETGRACRLVGVNIDITARKKAEEALKEADRRKDEFLAMLGHELRNPLGIISTSVELLRWEGPADSTLTELRAMMERQVEHMSQLLDDLLDISRINRGQIRIKKEPCNFTQTVREAAEDFRPRLEGTGLELIVAAPDRPLWLMGDRTRLVQVIGNLLRNAQKFTDIGGRITVQLDQTSDSTAALTIQDTGTGMEPEVLARAFEPFSQANSGLDRRGGGLGLGLALVKGLIDLHGGTVAAHSEGPGRGSEFTIRLPLAPPPAPTQQIYEPSVQNVRRYRILIIEDNPLGARTMRMLLTRLGHSVEVAHSGPEGIGVVRRLRPDIVLCDIGLPGMDGYAVARAIRAEPELSGVRLLAITGYGQAEDERRSLEAGFDMHLTKPVDLKKLQELLSQSCLHARFQRNVILATTTSTQDSGLLDVLVPLFEKQSGYTVKTVAVGTGQALALAAKGDADVALVHAPIEEKQYVASGNLLNRRLVMYNDFIIVGPADDPAKIRSLKSVVAALKFIAQVKARFVSRGDNSGTDTLEKSLWSMAGIVPKGPWYIESGQGMGATLNIASERNAYTLSDRGTYLALSRRLALQILVQDDKLLLNIYSVIEVDPSNRPRINGAGANAFANFMVAPQTQALIAKFGVDRLGQPLFVPVAGMREEEI